MKVKVTGFRKVNFTDQTTGRAVNGTSLYVVYPDPDVVGERSDKFFIDDNLNLDLSQVLPGVVLNLMFNRRGKVSSFDIVKQAFHTGGAVSSLRAAPSLPEYVRISLFAPSAKGVVGAYRHCRPSGRADSALRSPTRARIIRLSQEVPGIVLPRDFCRKT